MDIYHEYAKLKSDYSQLKKDYETLQDKYEKVMRRNKGLETQVANYKQKEQARYRDMGWRN